MSVDSSVQLNFKPIREKNAVDESYWSLTTNVESQRLLLDPLKFRYGLS
jgi:hypothetical protein